MNYRITVEDEGPLNSDWRNQAIQIADIRIKSDLTVATSIFNSLREKYKGKDFKLVMYLVEEKSQEVMKS